MTSLLAKIRANLTAKIVLLACASEVLLLAALGFFFLRGHNRDMHERLAEKLTVPATLMSLMALNFDIVTDLHALGEIVQEKVVDAFVARRTGDVYFASDPAKIGRHYTDFVEAEESSAAPGGGRIWHSDTGGAHRLSVLAPLTVKGDEIGHLFLEIEAGGVAARERRALLLYAAASTLAVLLTLLLAGFWVQRLFVPRIDRTVAVLEEVQAGRYSARLGGRGGADQIDHLMRSVDAMIERIDAHTEDLRGLAQAAGGFAAAESRADIQRVLTAAVGGRFCARPAGLCTLGPDAVSPLSEIRGNMVAAGEILLVGGAAGDADGAPARIYLPVVDRPEAREALVYALGAAGPAHGSEFFLRTLSGLLIDAIVRVDALAQLRAAEQEYRDLFDNAAEGIFRISPDRRLLAANPALARMLGYPSPAALLTRFEDSPGGGCEEIAGREEFFRRVCEEGEVRDFETILKRRDGTTLWVSLTGRAVPGSGGESAGIEGSIVDVSERKRREEAEVERRAAEVAHGEMSRLLEVLGEKNRQLEETYRQLQGTQGRLVRTEKMAAMGTMAAGVAHDLNNILSGIVGYPDLLLLDLPVDSPLRESIEAIRESGMRAAAVVADLLTLARGAAYPIDACDLNELVRKYLQSPEHQALAARHPDVRVATRLAADLRPTWCSRVHMQKVVMNLVMNAFEAIRTAGEVTVSTGNRTVTAGESGAGGAAPGAYVALRIEDSGPGIPAAELAHVFEPFFTKKVLGRSGTGLGLTVVWNTVQEHGGSVAVTSGASGASFTVLLPAAGSDAAPAAPASRAGAQLRGSGTVLVVDDERPLRELATRMLTALGYTVDAVSSGEAAVAWLRERPADLVLLDMLMPPGMNGCETYREIVGFRPGQKALICSGYSQSADYEEARRLGAGRFLKKPFGLEQLAVAVRQELAGERPPETA